LIVLGNSSTGKIGTDLECFAHGLLEQPHVTDDAEQMRGKPPPLACADVPAFPEEMPDQRIRRRPGTPDNAEQLGKVTVQ